eukprot:7332042-Alexandrium_andersonii.AAC.1
MPHRLRPCGCRKRQTYGRALPTLLATGDDCNCGFMFALRICSPPRVNACDGVCWMDQHLALGGNSRFG